MTNKKNIAIVLGIMCFALTLGICVQIRTIGKFNSKVGQNYEENNLRTQVLKYKERYDELLKETEKIDEELKVEIEKATQDNTQLEEAKNQIEKANKQIGLSEVTGPGVIITVADSNVDASKKINPSDLIVHDIDLLKIVNELKNAGAEAISINDQRIILTTPIMCGGNIININQEKIGSPFEIKAIGLPEALANLERPGGYLSILKGREIIVDFEKSEEDITIPKYSGVLKFKYSNIVN